MTIEQLPLSLLEADPRNPNVCSEETLRKLTANIQRNQLYSPLIVRSHPTKDGYYMLIDGHQRKRALETLGIETALCQIWDLPDEEVQLALASLNQLRGTDIPRKRAELLAGLTKTLSPSELANLIPETETQIQDLLTLLKTDTEAIEKKLKAEIAREKETLPIPLTFLLSPTDHAIWKEAYDAFVEGLTDRGQVLIQICKKALEVSADG